MCRHYLYRQDGTLAEIRGCTGGCEAGTARPLLRFEPGGDGRPSVVRFDNKGQAIGSILFTHANDSSPEMTFLLAGNTATMRWDFDPEQNKITRQLHSPDTSLIMEYFTFDPLGRVDEGNILFPDHRKFKYEYDATGRIDVFFLLDVKVFKPQSMLYSVTY